ncbi:hypothetical protein Goshw_025621, partial [Gossypium schwendimanii]|nr:hypothetical protein [Gossypium schwendimanii]
MALKECFLTNVERMRRGLGSSSSYGFCGHDFEDVLHVIRDCSVARDIWLQLQILFGEVDWSCLFGLIAWRIWRNRNLQVFQGISWSIDEVIKVSYSWAKHYMFDCKRFDRVLISTDSVEAIQIIQDNVSRNSNPTLVRRIHQLLEMTVQWRILH